MNVKQSIATPGWWCAALALVLAALSRNVLADSYKPPAGVPTPSYANSFVVIGSPGNAADSTGYGAVSYSYMVSATQITVQDWVDFLNTIDPAGANNLGLGPMTTSDPSCDNPWCASPFAYSGGSWKAIAFNQNGVNLSASAAAKLPIDWLSLNMAARYLNWMATGSIDSGAFTFTDNGGVKGNWPIASFNGSYPGPRLPLENELYKAMYRNKASNTYYQYPLGSGTPALAGADPSTGLHWSNVGGALTDVFSSNSGGLYAQVGQELGNPWGIYDFGGNRHETTLSPSAPTTTILRGASAFGTLSDSDKANRQTLDASHRYLSVGYRVWMGVTTPSGRVSVTKQVTGGTDATRSFSMKLDCTGTLYDESFTLKSGQTFTSSGFIPQGTSCTVTETPPTGAPTGYTYGTAVVSPASVTVPGDGSTVAITVTNPLQAACSINGFTVTPACNNNGTAGTAADDYRTFSLNLSGTAVGASYNLSANNGGTLTPTSGNYGSATSFRLQNGSAGNGTTYTITATDTTNSSCTSTATVSDMGSCSPTGTLHVSKTVNGKPAGFSSPNFTMQVACSDNTFDQTFTLVDGGSKDITGIPAGTACTVTEATPLPSAPAGYAYGTPVVSPSGAQTVGNGTTVSVAVTNPLNAVTCPVITVTPNPLANGTVGVAYTASPSASASDSGSYTYTWTDAGLPAGLGVDGSSGAVSGTPTATGNATVTASTTIAGQTCSGSTALTVNPAPTGSLTVAKAVTGKPAGFTSPTFDIQVDCSVDSFDTVLHLADGGSQTISGIPTNTTCTVTELAPLPAAPAGYNYGTPSVSPAGAQTIGNGTTVSVAVTNPLSKKLGSLQVSKVVSGAPSGFTSPNYTLHVDCSDDTFDQDVTITAGNSQTISNIPDGTACSVTEPGQPAPPTGYSYGSAVVTPSGAVTIVGDNTVTVGVENPLVGNCVLNSPTVTTQCHSNGTADTSDDTFSFTINTTGSFTSTTYGIQGGGLSVWAVPYGTDAGSYGNYLISGGNASLTLTDSGNASCQLSGITVTAPQPCSMTPVCTTIANTAALSGITGTDGNAGNDRDGAVIRANCAPEQKADLELQKAADQTEVKAGDTVVYTLTLTNKGPDDAHNVEVTDHLPSGVTYVSSQADRGGYDPASGIWTVGDVASGIPLSLRITVTTD